MTNLSRLMAHPRLWGIFLLFLLLPFLAFPEIIFGGQTLYWTDLSWIHYPRHIFAAGEWLAGRVPLWDPYQHNGLPFLAETQVGSLYPFSLIFLTPWLPSLELSLFILIHFTLAALFTFILARALGLGLAASTLAGLAFGLGGVLMAQVPNLNIMTGAVWLPLILYSAIQVTRRRRWSVALLAGIPLALQIFTAQPQIVFYTLVVVCSYSLYRVVADFLSGSQSGDWEPERGSGDWEPERGAGGWEPERGSGDWESERGAGDWESKRSRRGSLSLAPLQTLLFIGVMILSGLLLAAPQLLPTWELQQLSVRSETRSFRFLTENSLPPVMWLQLLLPGAFGNNVTGFRGGDAFQEDFIYIGLLPLLLVGFSLAQRHRRDLPFFLLLLLGGVLLAMGRYTPLYEYVIQYLPGFALFRIPARWLIVVNLALAVLAGAGMETLLQQGLSRRKLRVILGAGLLLLLVLALIGVFRNDLQNWSNPYLSDFHRKLLAAFLDKGYSLNPIYRERLLLGWLPGLTIPAFFLATNLGLALILLTLFARQKITPALFGLLGVIAISFDLIAAGGTVINPLQPLSWWSQLSGGAQYVVEHVGDARVFPLGMGSEKATVTHLGQYFPSVYQVRSAGGHGSSLMLARTATFLREAHPVQAIQVLGVRYLLTEGQMGADTAATYPIAYNDDSAFVYENREPLPRAFMVHRAVLADSPEVALSYFETMALDPRQTVVLETGEAPTLPAPAEIKSTATLVAENPQFIQIEANTTAPGYLVLLDTFYPGWQATLDGQDVPIYRANYLSRAVFVPPGQHRITFTYRPLSFKIGLSLALVILILLLAVQWMEKYRPSQKIEPDAMSQVNI